MRERELLTDRGSQDVGGRVEEMYATSMLISNCMLTAQTLSSIPASPLSLKHCPLTLSLVHALPSWK